jgi:archaellum component FlaC
MKRQETRTDRVFADGNSPSSMTEQMIQDALSELRGDFGSFKTSLDSVLQEFRRLRTELNELRSYVLRLNSDVDDLSADTGDLKVFQAKLGEVDTRLDKLEGDTGELKSGLSTVGCELKEGLSTLLDKLYFLKTDLGKLSGEADTRFNKLDGDTEELKRGVSNVTYALKVGLSTLVDKIIGLKTDLDKSTANIEESRENVQELWGHARQFQELSESRHRNLCNSLVPMFHCEIKGEAFKGVSEDLHVISPDPGNGRPSRDEGDFYIFANRPV